MATKTIVLRNRRLGYRALTLIHITMVIAGLSTLGLFLKSLHAFGTIMLPALIISMLSLIIYIYLRRKTNAQIPLTIVINGNGLNIQYVVRERKCNVHWADVIEVGARRTGRYYLIAIFLKNHDTIWLYRVKKRVARAIIDNAKSIGLKII